MGYSSYPAFEEGFVGQAGISRGAGFSACNTRDSASAGQARTQTPQPMQAFASMDPGLPGAMAPKGQASAQALQPRHLSGRHRATYPEEINIGVPCRWAVIAPQQHEQQLQMA